MLQRSPTYYLAPPDEPRARRRRCARWTSPTSGRTRSCAASTSSQTNWLARMSFEAPDELHAFLIESMRPLLPEGFDIDKHFTPRYRPWQQRIALVPDGDLFAALREGKASIVTDTIETFTEHGIKVSSR